MKQSIRKLISYWNMFYVFLEIRIFIRSKIYSKNIHLSHSKISDISLQFSHICITSFNSSDYCLYPYSSECCWPRYKGGDYSQAVQSKCWLPQSANFFFMEMLYCRMYPRSELCIKFCFALLDYVHDRKWLLGPP